MDTRNLIQGQMMATKDSDARQAVAATWEFLLRLLDRDATPGVLEEDRRHAAKLLRDYPYPCRVPDFNASETIEGRTFDAIETTQDAIDEAPSIAESMGSVLDLLTEFLGGIRDERRRSTETKREPAVIDGVSSVRNQVVGFKRNRTE